MTSVNGIAQTATAMSQADLKSKVSIALIKQQQDTAKQTGEALTSLIEAASEIGKNVDVRA